MHAVAPAEPWYVPSAQGEHRPLRAAGLDVPGPQAVATATPSSTAAAAPAAATEGARAATSQPDSAQPSSLLQQPAPTAHASHTAALSFGAMVPAAQGAGSVAPSEHALPAGHT